MITEEVMTRFGLERAAVCRWAKNNGVARKPSGGILAYDWTEEDCKRFEEREKPGWKKGRSRKIE